jgi:hypothetical protein
MGYMKKTMEKKLEEVELFGEDDGLRLWEGRGRKCTFVVFEFWG